MAATKGEAKNFDLGVVSAILLEKKGQRADGQLVNMGDIAAVNEHLYPKRGRSAFGLLVGRIALIRSKPEILKQHSELEGIDLSHASFDQLRVILGDEVNLVSTGE